MINVIFKDFNYEITQRRIEMFEKYNKVIQWGRKHPVKFMEQFLGLEFTDHQKYILLSTWTTKFAVWLMSRNSGKDLGLDTKIWMDDNSYKLMRDINVGDYVLDHTFKPTVVTAKSEIQHNDCYKIYFNDGEIIIAGDNHTWWAKVITKYDIVWSSLQMYSTETLYYILQDKNNIVFNIDGKQIIGIERVENVPLQCIEVDNQFHTYLCGEKKTATHNSYLSAPYMMTRTILIPNHHTYIMCPAGNQAQETFTKIEDLAKGHIQSISGSTKVFWDELVKINKGSDGFNHDKTSYSCEAYNGSSINTLNSNPKTIVGIRSNLNFYDEAGKVDREFFALTKPFCTQDTNFVTGKNLNVECYPRQLPNQIIYSSSAESIDSELYDQYKDCALSMIAGSSEHFACDISCELSLHPFLDGKPYRPLLDQAVVDDAFKKNEFRANREYFNKFDHSGGLDALVKRTTIISNSYAYEPIYKNEDGNKIYLIAYDPASKLDNSFVLIAELFRDKEKGWMVKIVNAINLIEIADNGDKKVIQKPEQIERIKQLLLDYNGSKPDYDNIQRLIIDAGSGGGGFDIAQFLLKDWTGTDKRRHLGLIDMEDKYMKEERNKFPAAIDKLTLANFTADKVRMYTACQDMINQGLVMFPKSLNLRCEMEYEEYDKDNNLIVRMVQMNADEVKTLTEIDLLKEELVGMQKTQVGSNVRFDTLPSKKAQGMHDDRSDCCAMICFILAQIRQKDLLNVNREKEGFAKLFAHGKKHRQQYNRMSSGGNNPFATEQTNPFLN